MTDPSTDRAERLADRLEDDAVPADDDATFEAPWQARVFGLALAFHEHQTEYDWAEFQAELVEAIVAADPQAMQADVESVYYRRWLDRFEAFLTEEGLLSRAEIDRRKEEFSEGERDVSEFVGDGGPH